MEWSFILAAVQRRIRFVVLCALLGALPGVFSIMNSTDSYEATASIGIASPTSGAGAISAANQPDRYVVSQISVVTSTDTLAKAAKKLGGKLSAADIADAIDVEQEPSTDIIHITATSGNAKSASAIANAVANVYITDASSRLVQARQPEINVLNARLLDVQAKLDAATAAIAAKMAPYIESARNTPQGNGFVPQASDVAGKEVQARDALSAEYDRIMAAKSDIELGAQNQSPNTIIEQAVTPSSPKGTPGKLILVGGTVLGGLAGVAVALVLAQLSSKVLDETSVAQMLGTTVVGSFPRNRALLDKPLAALTTTPPEAREMLERLSVRAEAMADPEIDHALTIAVVGTQPSAGTTTLTLALARRLSRSGYSVVIVDGDLRTQTVSEIFDASPSAGISAVLAAEVKKPSKPVNYFTETGLPKVEVLGVGKIERREALRRDAIGPILEVARDRGQIVLFDGGPLMGSALTLFASKAADVIVLAVPLLDQDQEILGEVAENLPTDRSRVLAVTTAPVRRRARRPDVVEADSTTKS
ncbi:MAG: hypothetical protein U0Q22_09115 [Acidimicrobiales bacterium]